jgi:hypothetical protein
MGVADTGKRGRHFFELGQLLLAEPFRIGGFFAVHEVRANAVDTQLLVRAKFRQQRRHVLFVKPQTLHARIEFQVNAQRLSQARFQ